MIHALECKHLSKGLAQINLRDNKVLLWCVVALSLSTVSSLHHLSGLRYQLMMNIVPCRVHPCDQ